MSAFHFILFFKSYTDIYTLFLCFFHSSEILPMIDLILLAFLHGTFFSCILLVIIFAIVVCLLLAFLISLLLLALADAYETLLLLSTYVEKLRANFTLGIVLALYSTLHFVVFLALAFKPWVQHVFLWRKSMAS